MNKEVMKQEQDDSVIYIQKVIEALYENSDPVSVEAAELLERINAKQEQGELETLNYTVSVMCKRCGSHEKYDLKVDYPLPQQRKPLKNDEFLELLLRKGSREIVFKGCIRPHQPYGYYIDFIGNPTQNVSIITSTKTGTGTVPALIGTPHNTTGTQMTFVTVFFEDLIIRQNNTNGLIGLQLGGVSV